MVLCRVGTGERVLTLYCTLECRGAAVMGSDGVRAWMGRAGHGWREAVVGVGAG